MRTKARGGFVKALRDAHLWLDKLLSDPTQTIETLAAGAGKTERSIRKTLSLALPISQDWMVVDAVKPNRSL
jgi:hypothetical protein